SNHYATVPGGVNNTAAGYSSFAAGRRAKANHQGAFVWADSADADFASTASNQFLIRATGGVGIGTNAPTAQLHVVGTARVSVLEITGGADLAEKFAVQGKIAPGMVVEIDPDHEGELRLSTGALNKRVAGVISGAKQLNAGVVLTDPDDKA